MQHANGYDIITRRARINVICLFHRKNMTFRIQNFSTGKEVLADVNNKGLLYFWLQVRAFPLFCVCVPSAILHIAIAQGGQR